jgi:hypothetical protein
MSSSSTKEGSSEQSGENSVLQQMQAAAAQKLAIEKKKLKVLKTALKEERAQRAQIEKDLATSLERIELFKQQMADKDTKYMQLYEENINLQEALIRETKNAGSSQG